MAQTNTIADRIKKIPGWKNMSDSELTAAVRDQMTAELVMPTESEISAAAKKAKDDDAGLVYDQRSASLSVNARPDRVSIVCVIRETATVDGRVIERAVLKQLHVADVAARLEKLSPVERSLCETIQEAVATYAEG